MIVRSTAPPPRIVDLLRAVLPGETDGEVAARPWTIEGDCPFWFSRAAWALAAIVEAHRDGTGRPPRLWLPDYFCNQSIWPARKVGASITFYPVDESLAPAWTACEQLARTAPPDLFLQPHYFGRPADLAPARAFCDLHGAALIEDAAHALMPSSTIGRAGDYVIWSLYKHLPVPDGGLLVVRSTRKARLDTLHIVVGRMPRKPQGYGIWLLKRLTQLAVPAVAALRRGASLPFESDPETRPLPPAVLVSRATRRIVSALAPRLPHIAAQRAADDRALRTTFKAVPGLAPLLPEPDGTWVPYRTTFRADDLVRARSLYDRIRATGNVVESWPDLPPEVRAEPELHRAALTLRNTVLALPLCARGGAAALAAAYGAAL